MKKEIGRRCYFPDDDGKFNIASEPGITGPYGLGLIVEGSPVMTNHHQHTDRESTSTGASSSANSPFFKPIASGKRNAELGTFNVKVVKAVLKKSGNKVDFDRLEQIHINVNEKSANINTITSAVQNKWGSNYSVVTADGLDVDDSAGTQG